MIHERHEKGCPISYCKIWMDGVMNMSKYDKMVECNRRVSVEKINLARITILEMVEEGERVTVPKLMVQTGLSRGFFYKNPTVRKLVDEAVEKQAGMVDPRKGILDMVMDNEIAKLHEQIRMAKITQKPVSPVELPRILGPRKFPSNCCNTRMNRTK